MGCKEGDLSPRGIQGEKLMELRSGAVESRGQRDSRP